MTPRGRRARANGAHKPGEECLFVEYGRFSVVVTDARENDRVGAPIREAQERTQDALARKTRAHKQALRWLVVRFDPRFEARDAWAGERPVRAKTHRSCAEASAASFRDDPVAQAEHSGLWAHGQPQQADGIVVGGAGDRHRQAFAVIAPLPLTANESGAFRLGEACWHGRAGGDPEVL